jgi:endonuclease YncB( thermonuclease family)
MLSSRDCTAHHAREALSSHGSRTPELAFGGIATWARVVGVYDGDTMTVVLPFHGTPTKFAVRISGIDTCEMRSKNAACKAMAVQARRRVLELVVGNSDEPDEARMAVESLGHNASKADVEDVLDAYVSVVWLEGHGADKYGRLLATVRASPHAALTFADVLKTEHLAYAYEGDTKLTEPEQLAALLGSTVAPHI